MTREEMMDIVIRRFGFEVEETIDFCRLCESNAKDIDCLCAFADLMEL